MICTVDMACTLDPLFFEDGATTWKVTPGGTESGCEPILDLHGEDVVKVLDAVGRVRAGIKKDSIESLD